MFKRMPITLAVFATVVLAATPASAADRQEKMIRTMYQVGDLVMPPPAVEATIYERSAAPDKLCRPSVTLEGRLIEQIRHNVQPQSWENSGGSGTIHYFAPTMSIVVYNTVAAHEQIADLLKNLRKNGETQVALEVRFLSVSEKYLAAIRNEDLTNLDCKAKCLTDAEYKRFIDALANDLRTNVCTAPKLTVFSSQEAILKLGNIGGLATKDYPGVGFHVAARPVVSADRRFVNLAIDAIDMDVKQANRATVSLPDGGTVILSGFANTVDVAETRGVPVLKNLPILDSLFGHVEHHREIRRVFVTVTPRIIVPEEIEERKEVVTEEQEIKPAPRQTTAVEALLREYDQACAEGDVEMAKKLARAALILDPTCFHRK